MKEEINELENRKRKMENLKKILNDTKIEYYHAVERYEEIKKSVEKKLTKTGTVAAQLGNIAVSLKKPKQKILIEKEEELISKIEKEYPNLYKNCVKIERKILKNDLKSCLNNMVENIFSSYCKLVNPEDQEPEYKFEFLHKGGIH